MVTAPIPAFVPAPYIVSTTLSPMRVLRGGSFFDTGWYVLAGYRYGDNPLSGRYPKYGVRCARVN